MTAGILAQFRQVPDRASERVRHLPQAARVFALVFIVIAASFRPGTSSGSNGNVEQWTNLVNSTFYGHQDFLFSYGPLFWLTGAVPTPYSQVTFWESVLFVASTNALFWTLLASACRRARSLVYLAAAYFFVFAGLQQHDVLLYLPMTAVGWFDFTDPALRERPLARRTLLALGLVVGFLFYVRFMFGLVALATFMSYLLVRVWSSRRIIGPACLLLGTLAGYLAVGALTFHHLSSIWTYIRINTQLSTGNSIDMTLAVGENRFVLGAALVASAVIVVTFAWKRRSLLLPAAVLLLLLLKLGFSRDDHYLGYFVIPTAAVALALTFDRSRAGRAAFAAVLVLLGYAGATGTFPGAPTHDALFTATDFSRSYAARLQAVYPAFVLDGATTALIGKETVDVYPYNNEYALANRLNYVHRPLFQNYMTLTPKLDEMNAQFFRSRGRPTFVLWTRGSASCASTCGAFDDFDNKYTLNEDPLTTTAILRNYHLVTTTTVRGVPIAVLRADATYAEPTRVPLKHETMRFGQWYDVPSSSGLTKLSPSFRLTAYGRIKSTLFRGGMIQVRYILASGDRRTYRLNALNAQSGVLASPLLDKLDFTGERVSRISFVTDTPNVWHPTFEADWFTLPDLSVSAGAAPMSPFETVPGLADAPLRRCDGSIDDVLDGSGQRASSVGLTTSGIVSIRGWLAYSAAGGIPDDATYLTVTHAKGPLLAARPRAEQRSDLVTVFHHQELLGSGFQGRFNLGKGSYLVGLAGRHGGDLFRCSQFSLKVEAG